MLRRTSSCSVVRLARTTLLYLSCRPFRAAACAGRLSDRDSGSIATASTSERLDNVPCRAMLSKSAGLWSPNWPSATSASSSSPPSNERSAKAKQRAASGSPFSTRWSRPCLDASVASREHFEDSACIEALDASHNGNDQSKTSFVTPLILNIQVCPLFKTPMSGLGRSRPSQRGGELPLPNLRSRHTLIE